MTEDDGRFMAALWHQSPRPINSEALHKSRDIGMPTMDGYQLMHQIRALSPISGGAIPAIALTTGAGEADQSSAITAGSQYHVSQPVEPFELIAVVAQLCGQHGGHRA